MRSKTYLLSANDLPFAQSMGFSAGSIVVDNPTDQWMFFPAPINRFIPPSGNAVIIAGVEQAAFLWQAPVGQLQPASKAGQFATIVYIDSFLSPSFWAPGSGMTNPMNTVGDIIVGIAAGAAARLGIGATGQVLTVVGGTPAWTTTNPMTTLGDIITGIAAGVAARLGIGAAGQVLTVVGGVPAWATPAPAVTSATTPLAADVTMVNANQDYDIVSAGALAQGTYIMSGQVTVVKQAQNGIAVKLWDGATIYAAAENQGVAGSYATTIPIADVRVVVPGGGLTLKITGRSDGAGVVAKATSVDMGIAWGNVFTYITYTKIA